MRRLDILNITPSNISGVPSTITVGNDFTSIFHGREWIDGAGTRQNYDTYDSTGVSAPVPPTGTGVLLATTFEIVENAKYRGKYTVYTKPDDRFFSSTFSAGETTIRVNEALDITGAGTDLTDGYITNISTYLFTITGEPNFLVLEQQNNDDRTLELFGRQCSGWGEVMLQNMLRQVQCFAGPSAPLGVPFMGQLWFDTITSTLMIKPTALVTNDWIPVNSTFSGSPGLSYRHAQGVAAASWVITHNLGLVSPFIAEASFFVNTVDGVKPILPLDVTYNTANQLTVEFSSAESGYAIVRSAP